MKESIFQSRKECWVCGTTNNLHLHHIYYGTSNRSISDKNGFTVYLCGYHHNLSNNGVHYNKPLDLKLKRECQAKFEEEHSREEFMNLIGRNYLD